MQRLRNIEVEKVGALSDYSRSLRIGDRARIIKTDGHFFPLGSIVVIHSKNYDHFGCSMENGSVDYGQNIRSECLELIR